MSATFNLTAALDKATYNPGETATLTVSGTVISSASSSSLAVNVTASDGSTTSLPLTMSVGGTEETWQITSVTDSSGRAWTVSADGHSATATA